MKGTVVPCNGIRNCEFHFFSKKGVEFLNIPMWFITHIFMKSFTFRDLLTFYISNDSGHGSSSRSGNNDTNPTLNSVNINVLVS